MQDNVFQYRLSSNALLFSHMVKGRYIYPLPVLSVFLSLLSWLEFQRRSAQSARVRHKGGELGMTAKPDGPLCIFVFIVTVFIVCFLPVDVCVHTPLSLPLRIYLSLHASSVSLPSTRVFSLLAAFIFVSFLLSR